jgi:hypothetical protein
VLCLFREERKEDATALWEKRVARWMDRAASAARREAGSLFSLRLPGERATLEQERERREVYGAAVSGERTALDRKREAVSLFHRALEGRRAPQEVFGQVS